MSSTGTHAYREIGLFMGNIFVGFEDLGSGYQWKEWVIRTMILGLDITLLLSCTALLGTHLMENFLHHLLLLPRHAASPYVQDLWSHCLQNETSEIISHNKTSVLSCYVQVVGHSNEKPNTSICTMDKFWRLQCHLTVFFYKC